MKKTYNMYTDPSHGWMLVKRNELKELGIANKISSCSYEHGDNVFLEEDCDAPKFIKALQKKGIEVVFDKRNTNRPSRIRNYYSYSA